MAEQASPEDERERTEFLLWKNSDAPRSFMASVVENAGLFAWLERARRARERERVLVEALEYVWPLIDLYGAPKGSMKVSVNFTRRHWEEAYRLARAALAVAGAERGGEGAR